MTYYINTRKTGNVVFNQKGYIHSSTLCNSSSCFRRNEARNSFKAILASNVSIKGLVIISVI